MKIPILIYLSLILTGYSVQDTTKFEFKDQAADEALRRGIDNPAQLDEMLTFPPAIAISRLNAFLTDRMLRHMPDHAKRAQELIPQIPGWVDYFRWRLDEFYKDANPSPGAKMYNGRPWRGPADLKIYGRNEEARTKMSEEFGHLARIPSPETVSIIAQYIEDHGIDYVDGDQGCPSVQSLTAEALGVYFMTATGKPFTQIPNDWRKWWQANKGNYPQLPVKVEPPWFPPPPPATPKPATPQPDAGAETRKTDAEFHKTILRYEALRSEIEKLRTPPPAAPVPQIPYLRTEEEARPWRWPVATLCTLLAAGAAYFILRPRH